MMPRAGKQSGFALISAIILIVVLAVLGVYMATMSGIQHETTSRSLLAARAYYGAKAGLEWGIHRAIAAGGTCLASTPFALTGPGLDGINVTVTCVQTYVYSAHNNRTYYITSLAEFGDYGSPDYVRRRMAATVANF